MAYLLNSMKQITPKKNQLNFMEEKDIYRGGRLVLQIRNKFLHLAAFQRPSGRKSRGVISDWLACRLMGLRTITDVSGKKIW